MNRKTVFAYAIIAIICIFTASACQELGLKKDVVSQEIAKLSSKKDVVDNVFTSSSIPETAFRISSDFQYLGKTDPIRTVAMRRQDQISSLERESYLFIFPKAGNTMEKGAIIRIYTITGDPNYWPNDMMRGKVACLQSGTVKIIDEEYEYCTSVVPDALLDYEKDLIREKGFTPPGCTLVKHMVRRSGFGNKSHIQIIYFEDCTTPENRLFAGVSTAPKSTLTDAERTAFDEFLKRSNKNIQILENQKATAPLIYERTPPVTGPGAGTSEGTIEEKLELLKKLHDKGLITNEEYERKKSELLDKI